MIDLKERKAMKRLMVLLVLALLYVYPAWAEPKIDKEKYHLLGSVQKVVTETAKLADKFGKWSEEKRMPSEIATFDEKGNLIEEDSYDVDGTVKSKAVYTYDTKENKAEEVSYKPRWRFFDGPVDSKDVYAYDEKGNLIEESSYNPDGTLKSKTIYTRDAKGNLIEEAFYNPNGTLKSKLINTYDAKGNRTEETVYNSDGTLRTKTVSTYDENGNKNEEDFYNPDLRKKETYTYESDSFGNWTKRTTSTWVTKFGKSYFEPSLVTYRTITYYGGEAK
jgi:hypothetical protein